MHDCDDLWIDSEPYAKEVFEKEHRAQLLAARQVDIIRVPELREKLTISTSIVSHCRWSEKEQQAFLLAAQEVLYLRNKAQCIPSLIMFIVVLICLNLQKYTYFLIFRIYICVFLYICSKTVPLHPNKT